MILKPKKAIVFYKKVIVETPRVSLENNPPNPLPTLTEYTAWLVEENLYDPMLNPNATANEK